MKKKDLIHTTILIVAVLLGYSSITYFINFLSSLSYIGALGSYTQSFVYAFLIPVLYAIACLVLIRNARKYTDLILKNQFELPGEEPVRMDLSRTDLIFVFIVGLGIYTVVQAIPSVLRDFYTIYSDKVVPELHRGTEKTDLATVLLKITTGVILIYAARPLSVFITKLSLPEGKADHNPEKDVL